MKRYCYSVILKNNSNNNIANSYGLQLADNENELRGIVAKLAMDNNPNHAIVSIDFMEDPLYKDMKNDTSRR